MSESEARLRLAAVRFHVVFREMTFAGNNGKAEAGGATSCAQARVARLWQGLYVGG
jgi:hypothetical protein